MIAAAWIPSSFPPVEISSPSFTLEGGPPLPMPVNTSTTIQPFQQNETLLESSIPLPEKNWFTSGYLWDQ